MPVVYVSVDQSARAAYLDVYKQNAVGLIDAHMSKLWANISTDRPWEEMVFSHRATQAYAYLIDPGAEANIERYPAISAGMGFYGTTHTEVAESYLYYFKLKSESMRTTFESYRLTLEQIPGKTDKPQVDVLVTSFIASHPVQ